MRDPRNLTRRGFLKGVALGAGALAGARLSGDAWLPGAQAATNEKAALVVINLQGGYNAIFPSAGSFVGTGAFGVTADNVADLGNDLIVDRGSFGSLPEFARTHMAAIGIRHGISDHEVALRSNFSDGTRNYAVALAAAMGGEAAIKVASIGAFIPLAPRPAMGDVSFQQITDMDSTIRALGGGPATPDTPGRNVAALAMAKAQAISKRKLDKNPGAMASFKDGYATSVETLSKPIKPFNFDEIASQYTGVTTGNSTAVDGFTSKMIGAELMIRAGANVVTLNDLNNSVWDSHGDQNGSVVRDTFARTIMPGLSKFCERMRSEPTLAAMNIVIAVLGDFARSLPGSDHQPNLTATVIGKYVKTGTTGRVSDSVNLPASAGNQLQFWAYLSSALKLQNQPFGANPHALVL